MITGMLVILVIVAVALGGIIALNWAPDRPLSTLTARWAPPPSMFIPLLGMQVHLRDQGLRDSPTPIIAPPSVRAVASGLLAKTPYLAALARRRADRASVPVPNARAPAFAPNRNKTKKKLAKRRPAGSSGSV
jgi:hypothetical protein